MRFALVASVALLLAACTSPSAPSITRRAWLGPVGDPRRVIVAPDTVRVGLPFTVVIPVAGSGSVLCNEPDGTSVSQSARVVRVEVFVRTPQPRPTCTDDIRFYPTSVSLTFTTAGNSTVRVVGASSNDLPNRPDSLERSIVVIP